jgi:hypothetical protein
MNPSFIKRLNRSSIVAKLTGKEIQDNIHPFVNQQISTACSDHDNIGVVIQYCHNLINLANITSIPNYKTELGIILFQIYYALDQCRHIFTHYDLHDNNCGVIPLHDNTSILYEYHITTKSGIDRVIRFRSRYIVKIFDYGKSYFSGTSPNGKHITSQDIFKKVKKTKICTPPEDYGFGTFPESYIDPQVVNHSHDLRLLYMLKDICRKIPELVELVHAVKYKTYYGTPSIDPSSSSHINTVGDAARILIDIITRINPTTGVSMVDKTIDMYSDKEPIGTLQVIGLTKKMMFVPNPKYR